MRGPELRRDKRGLDARAVKPFAGGISSTDWQLSQVAATQLQAEHN